MKTPTKLMLFLMAVLFANAAQAFYNPSTGRWLSRDPIEEKGGANVYGFISNNGLNAFDLMGLKAGCCGDDVTAPLDRTLQNIEAIFRLWTPKQKWDACTGLYDKWSGFAQKAWDIEVLAGIGFGNTFPNFSSGDVRCPRTVTFQGNCFYGGSVNYAMWAKVNKLCHDKFRNTGALDPFGLTTPIGVWSLPFAEITVRYWKQSSYGRWGDEEEQALAFTRYGYQGTAPGNEIDKRLCTPSLTKARYYAFQWIWFPVKSVKGTPPTAR